MPADVDMYGFSLSVGHRWEDAMVSVGAVYSFGSGHTSSLKAPPPGAPPENVFGPISERRDFVFFFIQGASVAAKKATSAAKDMILGPGDPPDENTSDSVPVPPETSSPPAEAATPTASPAAPQEEVVDLP